MDAKYKFTYFPDKLYNGFESKDVQEFLMKWSMKGNLKLQTFCFNEAFQLYQKKDLVDAFFQDSIVASTLQGMSLTNSWGPVGITASTVDIEHIPCSSTSMSLFKTLQDPENGIVDCNGWIMQCPFDEINNITVSDELRKMLLDKESSNYSLLSEAQRNEFLFCIFKHLCIGGQWCQYENNIESYFNTTKILYKDIAKVQKDPETKQLSVTSIVLKVVARGDDGVSYFPRNPENEQNFAYLIIDPLNRQITTLVHHYGGTFFS